MLISNPMKSCQKQQKSDKNGFFDFLYCVQKFFGELFALFQRIQTQHWIYGTYIEFFIKHFLLTLVFLANVNAKLWQNAIMRSLSNEHIL